MTLQLYHGDFSEVIPGWEHPQRFDCVFADPPDNIGLGYASYDDHLTTARYVDFLSDLIVLATQAAPIVWLSFNARWTAHMGKLVVELIEPFTNHSPWTYRPCTQVFTFGQHNQHWLGNNHRPLWCLFQKDAQFYPDAIRVPSWRQLHGDKRADARGKVPGDVFEFDGEPNATTVAPAVEVSADLTGKHVPGDTFDFPEVTGNSKQRRTWHPTQLHEGLVERVLKFSCPPGGRVLDPFAGTGTTLRVADRLGLDATGIEIDAGYCTKIREELGIAV